jgi:UDPglucose 6-dehydrogenase
MNDMANLCERVGADVEMVRRGMGMDPRIGAKFLFPGIGYGGSCFPKDVRAAMSTAKDYGWPLEILEAVHRVNERQKGVLADKILKHFGGNVRGKKIAVWGLAFKPGTDDIREAPALVVIDRLLAAGAKVSAHDPVAHEAVHKVLGDKIEYAELNYDAAQGASAVALMTEWHQFRRPNFKRLKEIMAEPVLFDGRNTWDADEVRAAGFTYYGIGRK